MGYLKKPAEKQKRASAQRLKSQQLVRSRVLACPFLIISKIGLEPYTNKVLLAARPYL